MENEQGQLSKQFNDIQQNEYPGNHTVSGEHYEAVRSESPPNVEKIDALQNITKTHDQRQECLDAISKGLRASYNHPEPILTPDGAPPPTKVDGPSITATENRIARVNQILKAATTKKLDRVLIKGKAKEDFDKVK
jgi:hypothetical protein